MKNKMKMKNILKNRLALSTVVTTLIILVVSVLLAGVVTYYAINVTSTRVQEESLSITYLHCWYSSGGSEVAFAIINTGGRDVVINKIQVRGQTADFGTVSYAVASPTTDLAYSSTAFVYYVGTGVSATALTTGTTGTAITLQSGDTMIVYIASPDSITINDIGLTVGITVFTSKAMYYKESNVQAQ